MAGCLASRLLADNRITWKVREIVPSRVEVATRDGLDAGVNVVGWRWTVHDVSIGGRVDILDQTERLIAPAYGGWRRGSPLLEDVQAGTLGALGIKSST